VAESKTIQSGIFRVSMCKMTIYELASFVSERLIASCKSICPPKKRPKLRNRGFPVIRLLSNRAIVIGTTGCHPCTGGIGVDVSHETCYRLTW
jgi:hypothetical protein